MKEGIRSVLKTGAPRIGKLKMMIRMFGLFGVILASGYLLQGVSYVPIVINALFIRQEFRLFAWRFAIMSLDFFFGISLLVAAIGLLLAHEWAKKLWLIVTSALVLTHIIILTLTEFAQGVSTFYLIWTWMVLLTTALSWWYFNKRSRAQ